MHLCINDVDAAISGMSRLACKQIQVNGGVVVFQVKKHCNIYLSRSYINALSKRYVYGSLFMQRCHRWI